MKRFGIFSKTKICIVVLSLIAVVGAIFWVGKNIDFEKTNAAGATVTVVEGERIYYTGGTAQAYTSTFTVDGRPAMCAQPSFAGESGTYGSEEITDSKILLLLYIYFQAPRSAEANELFGAEASDDQRLIYAHETLGQLYGTIDSSDVELSWQRLSDRGYTNIMNIVTSAKPKLASWVANNAQVWKEAQKYKAYRTISGAAIQDIVWIEPNAGGIQVTKLDAETETTTPQAGASSFAGTKFGIYKGDTKIMEITANENGVASTGNFALVLGTYTVKELSTIDSYNVSNETKTVTVNTVNGVATTSIKNTVKRGSLKFTKTNSLTQSGMKDVEFTIVNNATGASKKVKTGEDGKIDSGSLLYGTYTITELEGDSNLFCEDRNMVKTATIINNGQTVDLGEWQNECFVPKIGTEASDAEDGDKMIGFEGIAKVKDTVSYHLKEGEKYRIVGTLIDKSTGEPLKIDDEEVTAEEIFEAESSYGTVEINFEFKADGLEGKDLVVFEETYYVKEEAEDPEENVEYLVAEHKNLDDDWQTIHVAVKPPKTGVAKISDRTTMKNWAVMVGGALVVMFATIKVINRRRHKIDFTRK